MRRENQITTRQTLPRKAGTRTIDLRGQTSGVQEITNHQRPRKRNLQDQRRTKNQCLGEKAGILNVEELQERGEKDRQ